MMESQQIYLNETSEDYLERLKQIGSSISANNFEKLLTYFNHEQQMDSFRATIFAKLNALAKPIITHNLPDGQEMSLSEKSNLLYQIQESIYDLQLIESASNFQTFGIANAIFALNKKRCLKKIIMGIFYKTIKFNAGFPSFLKL